MILAVCHIQINYSALFIIAIWLMMLAAMVAARASSPVNQLVVWALYNHNVHGRPVVRSGTTWITDFTPEERAAIINTFHNDRDKFHKLMDDHSETWHRRV